MPPHVLPYFIFDFFLATQAKLRPGQRFQPPNLDIIAAAHAYPKRTMVDSPERRFDQPQNRPLLAAALEECLLRAVDLALIDSVERRVNFNGTRLPSHLAQELE
ncbi:MAG TPA: hypothetical protein VMR80_12795 [Candidatus Acidoferrum sp.]|nr:hypothetical protein [Candidatus Acidoferrum sp.]